MPAIAFRHRYIAVILYRAIRLIFSCGIQKKQTPNHPEWETLLWELNIFFQAFDIPIASKPDCYFN